MKRAARGSLKYRTQKIGGGRKENFARGKIPLKPNSITLSGSKLVQSWS